MLCVVANTYGFDRLLYRNRSVIKCRLGCYRCKVYVFKLFPENYSHMGTFWLGSCQWHCLFCREDIINVHKRCHFGLCRCDWYFSHVHLTNFQNYHSGHPGLHISLNELVCCFPPSGLHQGVEHNRLLSITLCAIR